MNTVRNRQQVAANINRLETYRHSLNPDEAPFYRELIKLGICFVVTNRDGELIFAPSKFVGYPDNNMLSHVANRNARDGRDTNEAISKVLGRKPGQDAELQAEYRNFCARIGIQYQPTGAFGCPRKYWGNLRNIPFKW